jgi:hypothetical protein
VADARVVRKGGVKIPEKEKRCGAREEACETARGGEEPGMGRRHQARDRRQGKCPASGRTQERDEPGRVPANYPTLDKIINPEGSDEMPFEMPLL